MKKLEFKITNKNKDQRLIFFHPLGCESTIWNELINKIGEDFEIITYEYPGINDSKYFLISSIQEYAELFESSLNLLSQKPTILIGHSLGGWVAQRVAINNKINANGLILLASSQRVHPKGEAIMAHWKNILLTQNIEVFVNELILWSFSGDFFLKNPMFIEYIVPVLSARIASKQILLDQIEMSLRYTEEQLISKIDLPTLIIEAEFDSLYPRFGAQELLELIPNASLVKVKSGHALLQENLPDVVCNMLPFISQMISTYKVYKNE
jgi:pimeloyl-ACP methyl ester carboxylesterase